MGNLTFGTIDYMIFAAMLIVSSSFGIYFGFLSKSKTSAEEYLMGGRKMKVIPVALSMTASAFSSYSIIGFPAETYAFGIHYYLGLIMVIPCGLFVYWWVLPIYYNNNLSSCYEYLELRFDKATRKVVTLAFVGTYILLLPIYLYLPSLALSQVTNINVHIINALMNGVCVFYTMIGGIKAVIWTDVVQGTLMFGAVLFVSIMGTIKAGGLNTIWRIALEGHRLDVDFTFDLETRLEFWNTLIYELLYIVTYIGFNQSFVQRMISLPTLKESRRSLLLYVVMFLVLCSLYCFNGLIMYAYYRDCDPILTAQVQKHDKMMPYFVQDVAGHLIGVPGLFIAGLFSAALSTASAAMNTLAGVVYYDYIKPFVKHTDVKANFSMKLLTLLLGIYTVLGGLLYERFQSAVELFSTITALFYGAMACCFCVGMFVPRVHGKCVFWGMIISFVVMLAFVSCAHVKTFYQPLGYTSTEACESNFSIAAAAVPAPHFFSNSTTTTTRGFNFLKMSFFWFMVMGALIFLVVSILLSFILPTTTNSAGYDRKLLAPIVYPLISYEPTRQDENTRL